MATTADLHQALRHALAATAETNPGELNAGDMELFRLCDQRCAEIVELLITRYDECGHAARALLGQFMLR